MNRSLLLSFVASSLLLFATGCPNTEPDDGGPPGVTDQDEDGVALEDDCDDTNSALGAVALDEDCDGVLTADDCDDTDATLNQADADSDGASTCDGDCDDSDAALNLDDADSDGASTCDGDCDDSDPALHPEASDGLLTDRDCDGLLSQNSLSYADIGFVGEEGSDNLGYAVSSAGDVDGDGRDDLLLGAAGPRTVYLFLSANLGDSPVLYASQADYSFSGDDCDENSSGLGQVVSSAGDVDGDELDDLLISAGSCNAEESSGGRAYLILAASLGSTASIDVTQADYIFVADETNLQLGRSASSAGDVDGDGQDDLLLGAPSDSSYPPSRAYLFLGSSLGTEQIISVAQADYTFVAEGVEYDLAGTSVAGVGDVDGDELDDLLVGAPGNDDGGVLSGKAYLILGGSLGTPGVISLSQADSSFIGEEAADQAGHSVAGAGDVDGDGLADLLVGAPHNGEQGGKTYLILGASLASTAVLDLSQADYSFVGESSGDWSGWSVAAAGDVDGDDLDDILVGAHRNNEGGELAGKTYLILGSSLGTSSSIPLSQADFSFIGEGAAKGDAQFSGESVSCAGDVDGNGRDDLLIGARANDEGGDAAGKAYLILSNL